MSWSRLATATYSTTRPPAISSGKRGIPVTHLTGIKCTPIMPAITGTSANNPMPNLDPVTGQVKELWEVYAESQSHTDSGSTVNQVPDIREGDFMVIGSVEYHVRRVLNWPDTSTTLAFIRVILEESVT